MTVTKLSGQIDIVFSVEGTVDRARLNVIKERIEKYVFELNEAVEDGIEGLIKIKEPCSHEPRRCLQSHPQLRPQYTFQ